MVQKEVYLTKEGYDELKARLEELTTVARHEIAAKIKRAREFGDLSENAEYEEAKQEQGFIEGEIMEIEYKLKNAVIIEKKRTSKISMGSCVKVYDRDMEEEVAYTIVGSDEVDIDKGFISNESPMGTALLGHKKGDVVTVDAPMGKIELEILSVS